MGALRETLEGISGLDMLVFSGGSSAGEKDLVVDLVREKGHVVFHGIAVKPGRPTLLGVVEGRPVVGMPGFPASALTISYLLLGPIVRRMARLPPSPGKTLRAVLAEGVVSTKGRTDVVPVRLEAGRALPILKGSASITAVAPADGYILVPPEIEGISSGSEVEVFPF
jgi:molybdopterin biosynthesis enzyme